MSEPGSPDRPNCAPGCGCHASAGGVSRRTFVAMTGGGIAALALGANRAIAGPFDAQTAEDHCVPTEKKLSQEWLHALFARGERTWYSGKDLETIGLPVCGVCTGQLYLSGDGRLVYWGMLQPNFDTGWGANNYKVGRKPTQLSAQRGKSFIDPPHVENGFALRIKTGDRTLTRTLDARGFKEVRFAGEYPVGLVEYMDPEIPVSVQLEAFSPFIPLQTEDSTLPATVLNYTLKNNGATALQVTLAGWLENAVCRYSGAQLAAVAQRLNARLETDGAAGVVARLERTPPPVVEAPRPVLVVADFEGGNYGEWKVDGQAFGAAPAKGALPQQQPVSGFSGKGLVNTFLGGDAPKGKLTSPVFTIERKYIGFLIGGGEHAGRTCINLLVDGKVVRTQAGFGSEALTPQSWDVRDLQGRPAMIEIVDAESGPWGHVNVDQIEQRDVALAATAGNLQKPPDDGSLALAVLGRDGTAASLALPDGVPADVLFDAAGLADTGAVRQPLDRRLTGAAARTLELRPGESQTVSFVVAWHFPNLYVDRSWAGTRDGLVGRQYANRFADAGAVASYVAREYERLCSGTRLWHRTYYDTTLPCWLLDRIGATTCNLATNTCQWWENGRFWAWEGVGCCHGTCGHVWNYAHAMGRLFPQLERSVREMQDFKPGVGLNEKTGAIIFRGTGGPWAGDSQGGYVLKALREHQCSANPEFLKRNWPNIRKATQFLLDQDGNADGILEGKQHNTYDIDFVGANTMVGSLYLGALRAAEEMAREVGDAEFSATCRKVFEAGSANSVKRLFNGEYFIQDVEQSKGHDWQYADGCLADQLFGQGWAHQVGLGYVYPQETVRKALASIWKYCWAPDVAPQNKAHGPERWFAYPGEAGLFTCTWPKSKHMGPKSVRYRDEVWTGIEYQVANHMAWEGMLTEAFAICRAVHDRYHPSKHNPFNEIECGDHYARALAAWGMLTSLSGFEYHGPRGHLGFAPRITPAQYRSVFTAAEGWGLLEQKREAVRQVDTVMVRYGRVRLQTLALELPAGQSPQQVTASLDGQALEARTELKGNRLTLTFNKEVIVPAGGTLSVTIGLQPAAGQP